MTTSLNGQRILLIGIGFYDYESAIADTLRALGASVTVVDERAPGLRNWTSAIRRKLYPVGKAEQQQYLGNLITTLKGSEPFDYVLVIKGELLTPEFMEALKLAQPLATYISYQWDSIDRFPEILSIQRFFDRTLTFDHADSQKFENLVLRPTFFRPEITDAMSSGAKNAPTKFCFIGWLHHDRVNQVSMLRRQIQAMDLPYYFYLYTGTRTFLKYKASSTGADVHFKPLSFKSYANQIATTDIIIDLPHPKQHGLTMRALEAVATGKKLITTSRDIKLYDFYTPEQFSIIDAENPVIDISFIDAHVKPLDQDIIQNYSLATWALDVFGLRTVSAFLK